MAAETKAEIVVVAAAGAFMLWLWYRNSQAGAPSGTETLPALSDTAIRQPGASLFDIPSPVAGVNVSYDGSPLTFAASDFGTPAGMPSSCNCAGQGQMDATFGSRNDLVAWLERQPGLVAATADASSNWY